VVPRGLPVGTAVKGLDGRWRVVLASDKAPIDFVRILLFQDFTQVVSQKALSETPVPPPTAGPNGAEPAKAPEAAPNAPPPVKAAVAPTPVAATPIAKKPDAKPASGKPDATAKSSTPTKPKPKPPADGAQP
jgi:rod shape-determining protein MreC